VQAVEVAVGVPAPEASATLPPLVPLIATADCPVTKPLPFVVTWHTCVASPQEPGPEFTVARVRTFDAEVVASPDISDSVTVATPADMDCRRIPALPAPRLMAFAGALLDWLTR
jgi:hypothetical protein